MSLLRDNPVIDALAGFALGLAIALSTILGGALVSRTPWGVWDLEEELDEEDGE